MAFCITVKRGNAVFNTRPMPTDSSGITTRITRARRAFMVNAMIKAPTNIPGALNIITRAIRTTICTCCTSLVRRVTREPVLKSSIFLNENCWTL